MVYSHFIGYIFQIASIFQRKYQTKKYFDLQFRKQLKKKNLLLRETRNTGCRFVERIKPIACYSKDGRLIGNGQKAADGACRGNFVLITRLKSRIWVNSVAPQYS